MAPVCVLPAGWGHDVTSHVGGASMGRPVSTIVRKVLSYVIRLHHSQQYQPSTLIVPLQPSPSQTLLNMPSTVSEWSLMSGGLWQV